MSDDIRLDLLRDAIANSELDGQTRDALADDLRYAQDINGTDNEALRGIKRLLISGVRRELLAHDRVRGAVNDHAEHCPAMTAPRTLKAAIQQIAAQYPIIVAIMILLAAKELGVEGVAKIVAMFTGH